MVVIIVLLVVVIIVLFICILGVGGSLLLIGLFVLFWNKKILYRLIYFVIIKEMRIFGGIFYFKFLL